jgi:hypothetical protein
MATFVVAAVFTLSGAGTTAGAVSVSPTGVDLSFPAMGLPQSYTFSVSGTSIGIQIPVPAGLRPDILTATLVIPPNFGTGVLVAQSGTTYVGSFGLPPASPSQQVVPVVLPLAGVQVSDRFATFSLTLEQTGALAGIYDATVPNAAGILGSLTCSGPSPLPLHLINPAIAYVGSFTPSTSIATFFPTVARQLIIYVPPTTTPAEQTTALHLAAEAAHAYGLVPVAITARAWNGASLPPAPANPLDRAVYIHESSTTGLDVVAPTLLEVSGNAQTLPEQNAALAAAFTSLLQAPAVSVRQASEPASTGTGELTFSQLGLTGTVSFSGEQRISITLDQTRLGGVASSVGVDLVADYTPVELGARGTVSVTVGGDQLDEASLGSSGRVNLQFIIPRPLLTRSTTMLITPSYFPASFTCGPQSRTMTFTIDPQSTVSPTLDTDGTGGFPSVPQSLEPTFQVAFDQPTIERLAAAVDTVVGLQRLSSTLLQSHVVPLATATSDGSPVLVVADAQAVQHSFLPPIHSEDADVYRVTTSGGTTFTMTGGVSAIQVLDDTAHHRTAVLVTTSASWGLVDDLVGWLGNTSQRWGSLTGDVLASGPAGNPVNLTVLAGGPQTFSPPAANSKRIYLPVAAAFVLAVIIIALVALLVARRRHRSAATDGGRGTSGAPEGS